VEEVGGRQDDSDSENDHYAGGKGLSMWTEKNHQNTCDTEYNKHDKG
jgi:hypothetical protein